MALFIPFKCKAQQGFTLVELVIVIIILSALGIMTSSYIGTGIDIYSDIAGRDRSLSSVRFAMERLRREASNALPNSARLSLGDQCLSFTPIVASTLYGSDFPISPLSSNSANVAALPDYAWENGDLGVVYLLASSELSGSKKQPLSAINTDKDLLSFSGSISFPLGSPAQRLYIVRESISYYFSGTNLYRSVASGIDSANDCDVDNGILMAEHITGSFSVSDATLQRNGLVQATFNLEFDGQEVPVEETLHINNVP